MVSTVSVRGENESILACREQRKRKQSKDPYPQGINRSIDARSKGKGVELRIM